MMINESVYERIQEKKKRLDSLRPLSSEAASRLRNNINIELTYNSNAIEGNTLTLQETKFAIEEGITVGGKPLAHYIEATNHYKALEFIEGTKEKIDDEFILKLHELILKGVSESAGRYRTLRVRIVGADLTPPEPGKLIGLMREFAGWVNTPGPDPIELAALAHHKLVKIHPFQDGNGRTARLLMNLILIRAGFPPTMLLFKDRKKYYSSLKTADYGEEAPFVNFIARNTEQSLNRYLEALERPTKANRHMLLSEAAAKYSGYSQEYLSLLSRKGLLGSTKISGKWMISREEMERYTPGGLRTKKKERKQKKPQPPGQRPALGDN
jgi:Fic family protein